MEKELEKKAENYCWNIKNHLMEKCGYPLIFIKKAYKDGFYEGQKEEKEKPCRFECNLAKSLEESIEEGYDREVELKIQIANLEKEIEYLHSVNEEQKERILDLSDELKSEIAFNEQSETVKKYKAQIEQMKCCWNCKLYDCSMDCKHTKCKYQYSEMCRTKNMIDKWELEKC